MGTTRIAVVGAGIAGLSCARVLADAGFDVRVFDKGRGPGGRCATRRAESLRFDHGAQYFTARDPAFREVVASWQRAGAVERWTGRLLAQGVDGRREPLPPEDRFVGAPTMGALGRHLARDLAVGAGLRVSRLEADAGWQPSAEDGSALGRFDATVLAVPAPQAPPLLTAHPDFAARIGAVSLAPCWATLLGFPESPDADFDALALQSDDLLAWLARNETKPGREPAACWTLHARGDWSRAHLELEPDDAGRRMRAALEVLLEGGLPEPSFQTTHRWRYALVEKPLGEPFLWDEHARLGVCGDWCIAPRIEAAWQSGVALARRMAEAFTA